MDSRDQLHDFLSQNHFALVRAETVGLEPGKYEAVYAREYQGGAGDYQVIAMEDVQGLKPWDVTSRNKNGRVLAMDLSGELLAIDRLTVSPDLPEVERTSKLAGNAVGAATEHAMRLEFDCERPMGEDFLPINSKKRRFPVEEFLPEAVRDAKFEEALAIRTMRDRLTAFVKDNPHTVRASLLQSFFEGYDSGFESGTKLRAAYKKLASKRDVAVATAVEAVTGKTKPEVPSKATLDAEQSDLQVLATRALSRATRVAALSVALEGAFANSGKTTHVLPLTLLATTENLALVVRADGTSFFHPLAKMRLQGVSVGQQVQLHATKGQDNVTLTPTAQFRDQQRQFGRAR